MNIVDSKDIIKSELRIPGIKSIILIGSRAIDKHVRAESDYDLYIVLSFLKIPFLLKSIKLKEKKLKERLGCEVSIAPLTTARIKHGNDLLILKTKKQGLTIWGKDYLPEISINSINEIDFNEFFSYLFSSFYFLIKYFNPSKNENYINSDKFQYLIAKSLLYSFETELYVNGIFTNNKDEIFNQASIKHSKNDSILKVIDEAKKIIKGDTFIDDDLIKFWFTARDVALVIFRELVFKYNISFFNEDKLIEDLIDSYKNNGYSWKKNIQYVILALFEQYTFKCSGLIQKKSFERYLQASLLYILLSINNDLSIDKNYIIKAKNNLSEIGLFIEYDGDNINLIWQELKQIIIDHWLLANGKKII